MKKSRRKFLVGSVLTAGAAAIPGMRHAKWNSQSFEREGYLPQDFKSGSQKNLWLNWSGLHKSTPKRIMEPEDEAELQQLLKESIGPIRPLGSGHSFSPLVPSEGTIIKLNRFNGLKSFDTKNQIATFGAGTNLMQAARELNDAGLAFPNLPDVDVQTLAGSFSTATHGTGRELTALHDYISGFKLITAEGEVLSVNSASHPDLFSAGKVSLGALGILVEYSLKLVPAFSLRRRVWLQPIDELLEESENLSRKYRNFEFYYFPGTGYAAAITHEIFSGPVAGRDPGEDEEMLESLRQLRDVFGWSPWLRRRLFKQSAPIGLVEDSTDESWRLLSTHRPTRFNEIEYELPADKGIEVIREVIRILDSRKEVFFPIEARYIAKDDAWLSPFNDGNRFAISVHAAVNESFDYFYEILEPLFRNAGGRPHWGKLHSLRYNELSKEYPMLNQFADLQKELDPQGKLLNPHLSQILGHSK